MLNCHWRRGDVGGAAQENIYSLHKNTHKSDWFICTCSAITWIIWIENAQMLTLLMIKNITQIEILYHFLFLVFMPILQVFFFLVFFFFSCFNDITDLSMTWSCNMYKKQTNVCYQKKLSPLFLTLLLNVTNGTGFYHQQPFEHWVYYHNDTSAYHLLE